MKAMVLAAGVGSRLRPLTDTMPKAMVPVGGSLLSSTTCCCYDSTACVRDVAINLHAHPQAIPTYVVDGSRWGLRVTYLREGSLLGTAGAVKRMEDFLGDATFAVVYGDNLSDCDLTALLHLHRRSGAVATLALHVPHDPRASGIVNVDETGRVCSFVEKPATYDPAAGRWANAGVYILEPSVLQEIPTGVPYDFGHDLFPRLLEKGRSLYAAHVCSYLLTIDTPERYAAAQEFLA